MKHFRIGALLLSVQLAMGGSLAMADEFTVYVVRHAEKAVAEADPPLNNQGQQRALALASMLHKASIEAIYSTPYQRTKQTVTPLAEQLGLAVQSYRPGDVQTFAAQLRSAKENALVVGHSNTVPGLVNALGGQSEKLTEQDYGDLFQLTFRGCNEQGEGCSVYQVRLFVPAGELN